MFMNCNNTNSQREVRTKTLILREQQKYGKEKNVLLRKICICFLLAVICMMLPSCTTVEFANEYNTGQSYYKAGMAAFERGDLDDAMYNFDMAEWHFGWASWNYSFRIDDISEFDAEAVRKMAAITKMWRGYIFSQQDQQKKALKKFSEALSCHELSRQQRATIIGMRGSSYFALGNRTNATEDYHKALKLDPKNDVVGRLGNSLGF